MDFQQIKQIIKERAAQLNLDQYEVYYSKGEDLSAETLAKELSGVSYSASEGVSFRCILNGKVGGAFTELLNPEEIASLVDRAAQNATFIESDDPVFLFEGSPCYPERTAKVDSALPGTTEVRNRVKKLAGDMFDYADKSLPKGQTLENASQCYGFAFSSRSSLYNSHGLELEKENALAGVMSAAMVKEGEDIRESYKGALWNETDKIAKLGQEAICEAQSKLHPGTIPSGKYPIVISGEMMATLLQVYFSIFSSETVQRGLSLLGGKEGQKIASELVTIVDDPLYPGNPLQATFDGEGVATFRKSIVEKGVLKTLLYNLSTAHKAGCKTTGNGSRSGYSGKIGITPYTVIMEKGTQSFDSLLAQAQNGIYLTSLQGLHAGADPVTGDFSLQSSGYRIENGKVGGPIHEFTVAGNFYSLLQSVGALSDRVYFEPRSITTFSAPDVYLPELSVAGKEEDK